MIRCNWRVFVAAAAAFIGTGLAVEAEARSCASVYLRADRLLDRAVQRCLDQGHTERGSECEAKALARRAEHLRAMRCDHGVDATLDDAPPAPVAPGAPDVPGLDRTQGATLESHSLRLWPNAVIPYVISKKLDPMDREDVKAAIRHWKERTIVHLRERRSTDTDYVEFIVHANDRDPDRGTDLPDCYSEATGRKGGRQVVAASRCGYGSLIHEIGHVVGLHHEQKRQDRNKHLTIDFGEIDDDWVDQYTRYESGTDRGDFDFNSIMLYPAIDGVMTKKDGSLWETNRSALSTGDITAVMMMYSAHDVFGTPWDYLRNASSRKCMRIYQASKKGGAGLMQYSCKGSWSSQRFHWWKHPQADRFLLVNRHSGLCIQPRSPVSASGQRMIQAPCHGKKHQSFQRHRLFPWEPFSIENEWSKLCLQADGSRNNSRVRQRKCNGSSKQKWEMSLFNP